MIYDIAYIITYPYIIYVCMYAGMYTIYIHILIYIYMIYDIYDIYVYMFACMYRIVGSITVYGYRVYSPTFLPLFFKNTNKP